MIGTERAWQLGLHRLSRAERGVQPGMLPRERLVALVDLVREENGLGLRCDPNATGSAVIVMVVLSASPCSQNSRSISQRSQ
jgi:hypothetical protein